MSTRMSIPAMKFLGTATLLLLTGCTTRLSSDSAVSIGSGSATSQASQGIGVISPENTQIRFVGSALLISHEGTFTRFTGQLTCPGSDPALAQVSAQVEMGSVYTRIPLLTRHLKDSDFFDTDQYPTAAFVSRQIAPDPASDKIDRVTGQFTIHGVTKTIAFPATVDIQPATIHFKASFTIRQSDFGMNPSRTTSDDVSVTIDSTVRRK